ncbi:TIGR03619 family F420-dependent LLM class oxidoreductase [Pseudonocardia xishanensis]|uniref:LLM class flavin-dependent oxidoreductase n=1 Tax=Pseudonocardia xishanensis TaxID=630995 RepID=A0ABP8RQX2_9PSEU
MKFVASITMVDPEFYLPLARAAEEAGFDGVSVSDSVGYPRESDSRYPYTADGSREFLERKPFLEPMVALAAMAAVTSTVELIPFVLKLPIRNPVLFAKTATSVAVLSDNRLRLGVGTSPWPDDYALVGLEWKGRGRRFEECIAVLRALQTGDYAEHDGEFYSFPAVRLNPVPDKPIPLLLAGESERLLDRAARIGDGWVSTHRGLAELEELLTRLHTALGAHGRQGEPFDVHVTAGPDVDTIRRLEEIGVTHVHAGYPGPHSPLDREPDSEPLGPKIDRLRRFGDEVIAGFRG